VAREEVAVVEDLSKRERQKRIGYRKAAIFLRANYPPDERETAILRAAVALRGRGYVSDLYSSEERSLLRDAQRIALEHGLLGIRRGLRIGPKAERKALVLRVQQTHSSSVHDCPTCGALHYIRLNDSRVRKLSPNQEIEIIRSSWKVRARLKAAKAKLRKQARDRAREEKARAERRSAR
jgi:hypothetical protein